VCFFGKAAGESANYFYRSQMPVSCIGKKYHARKAFSNKMLCDIYCSDITVMLNLFTGHAALPHRYTIECRGFQAAFLLPP
jgi:hypothetical protein